MLESLRIDCTSFRTLARAVQHSPASDLRGLSIYTPQIMAPDPSHRHHSAGQGLHRDRRSEDPYARASRASQRQRTDRTPSERHGNMVMLLSPTGNCFRHPYEQTRSLRQLVTNAKKLQQALEELTSRCPGLATASDLQHFASRLLAEVEGGIGLDHRTPYQPVSGWFQSDVQYLDWLADSERKIEQGLKYVKDTHDCARLIQRSTLSRAIPHTTNRLLGLRKSTEEVDGPTFVLQALNRVRERLEMLNNSHTTPTPRCFVSLFIRDHLKDAQLDDHVLIANASSCFAQQQADGIEDAKQFFAVYGDCADLPAARKYSDAFLHLYGLTPTEARGSLRDGPVTDVINERANYIYRNGQDGSSVKEEFRRFLAEFRRWSYLPGVGSITVPEFTIDEDLERVYWDLRHALDAANRSPPS